MDRDKYEAISAKAQALDKAYPRLYIALAVGMVVLGYGYIFLVLLFFLLCDALLIMVLVVAKRPTIIHYVVMIPCLVATWMILKGLLVKRSKPEGRELTKKDAPEFCRLLEEIRLRHNGPTIHKVYLDGSFNAGVSRCPKLGLLGWNQNIFTVGLALLESLTPEQFRAVVSHEIGHLAHIHVRRGAWFYRIQKIWQQQIDAIPQQNRVAKGLLLPFYRWYAPRFSAFTLVLSRKHELEADQFSVREAGVDIASSSLIRLSFIGNILSEDFWPGIYDQVKHLDSPPSPYTRLDEFVKKFNDTDRAQFLVSRRLNSPWDGQDTHPSLVDRLAAMDTTADGAVKETALQRVSSLVAMTQSAADVFLADQKAGIFEQADEHWKSWICDEWQQRRDYLAGQQQTLNELREKKQKESLNDADQLAYARMTELLDGAVAALPIYEQMLVDQPDHLSAKYAAGRIRLENKDVSGVAMIEQVIEKDITVRPDGCELLLGYYYGVGDFDNAKLMRNRLEDACGIADVMQKERSTFEKSDTFLSHDLPKETVSQIQSCLSGLQGVRMRAYLVRKQVHVHSEIPCYYLVIWRRIRFWQFEWQSAEVNNQKLANQIGHLDFGVKIGFRIYVSQEKPFRKIRRLPDAKIFG